VVFRITIISLAKETFDYPPPQSVGGYLTVFCVWVYLYAFSWSCRSAFLF
jgi:hypothetical protein